MDSDEEPRKSRRTILSDLYRYDRSGSAIKTYRLTCALFVGLGRFELPTFGPPDRRANQAAPQPAAVGHSTGGVRR